MPPRPANPTVCLLALTDETYSCNGMCVGSWILIAIASKMRLAYCAFSYRVRP